MNAEKPNSSVEDCPTVFKGIPAFYINREKKIRILSLSFRIYLFRFDVLLFFTVETLHWVPRFFGVTPLDTEFQCPLMRSRDNHSKSMYQIATS